MKGLCSGVWPERICRPQCFLCAGAGAGSCCAACPALGFLPGLAPALLWGSKIRAFTACELCLSGCPHLFVHPSLGDVNHTLAAQVLVLSLSLSARVPGQAPAWQCRIYLQELLAGLADGARSGGSHQGGTVPTTNRWLQLK